MFYSEKKTFKTNEDIFCFSIKATKFVSDKYYLLCTLTNNDIDPWVILKGIRSGH
jgi:hypothetical protein